MKYLKPYNKNETEDFIKEWDLTEIITDCFLDYIDNSGEIDLVYAKYNQNSEGKYVLYDGIPSLSRSSLSQLKRMSSATIEKKCGWILSVKTPTINTRYNRDYHSTHTLDMINKKTIDVSKESIIFHQCLLRLSGLIPNYIMLYENTYIIESVQRNILIFPDKKI
jgi:hypothetical protein